MSERFTFYVPAMNFIDSEQVFVWKRADYMDSENGF